MSTVTVRYVGLKDREFDKKGGTGLWWSRGESKAVPLAAWQKMSKHPDVWALDSEDAVIVTGGLSDAAPVVKPEVDDADLVAMSAVIVPVDKPAEKPDLYTMNTAALRDYAKAKGYDVDLSMKGAALRTAIQAIEG